MEPEIPGSNPIKQNGVPEKQPEMEQALQLLSRYTLAQDDRREAEFIRALRGESVAEIDRFQVYSHYSPDETVVFIHDATGSAKHKYIFAETGEGHSYIVAAPTSWTGYHREILARVTAAHGARATCPGGGYVSVNQEGEIEVYSDSVDFGRGDHPRAKEALERAVRNISPDRLH
jgi:hypothetical protein